MTACSAPLTSRLIATEFFFLQWGQVKSTRTCGDTGLVAIREPSPSPQHFLTYCRSYLIPYFGLQTESDSKLLIRHQGITRTPIKVFYRLTAQCVMKLFVNLERE